MRTCDFDGCDRKHHSNGLCQQHNRQRKAGKELTPIRRWVKATNMKTCNKCDEEKPKDEYYRRSNGYYCSTCKVCVRAAARARWRYMAAVVAEHEAKRTKNNDVAPSANEIAEPVREAVSNHA